MHHKITPSLEGSAEMPALRVHSAMPRIEAMPAAAAGRACFVLTRAKRIARFDFVIAEFLGGRVQATKSKYQSDRSDQPDQPKVRC